MDELINVPLIALEGAAYAGKTTLLNHLRVHHSDKIVTIPEASEFVGGDKNFPDVPFKTLDDAKASTHFFLELEKNRLVLASKLHRKTGLPVLLDRTTPVSSLIFYQLLKHTSPNDSEFISEFYRHAISVFDEENKNGRLAIPGNIIYIRPDSEDIFNSRLSRGTKNTVFSNWDSFRFLDDKYSKLIGLYYKNNSLVLNSENTIVNLEEQSKRVLKFVDKIKPLNLNSIFENFLEEGVKPYPVNLELEFKKFSTSIERCRNLIKNNKLKYEW